MSAKFRKSAVVCIDRKNKVYKKVHYLMSTTKTSELVAAMDRASPKQKQKIRKELIKRNVLAA